MSLNVAECASGACLQTSNAQRQEQQQVVEEIELRRKMKSLVVPTVDADVRKLLRRLGEPITLFGERQVSSAEQRLLPVPPLVLLRSAYFFTLPAGWELTAADGEERALTQAAGADG